MTKNIKYFCIFMLMMPTFVFCLHIMPDGAGGFYIPDEKPNIYVSVPKKPKITVIQSQPTVAQSLGEALGNFAIGYFLSDKKQDKQDKKDKEQVSIGKKRVFRYVKNKKNKDGGKTHYQSNGSSVTVIPADK